VEFEVSRLDRQFDDLVGMLCVLNFELVSELCPKDQE
jgi:hypothetical protein